MSEEQYQTCVGCQEPITQTPSGSWVHVKFNNKCHLSAVYPSTGFTSTVDLHNRITDMLMECFVPKMDDNPTGLMLMRRAVSSIADDIVKMAEDTYGVES